MPLEDVPRIHPASAAEWRAWLAEHHATATGVWLVSWRSGSARTPLAYEDQVLEALAYGWIDATVRRLDDERRMTYFAPRRKGSGWARSNRARIDRLRAEGRMAPAGEAAVERAVADGSWTLYDDAVDLVVPEDLEGAFARHPGSRANWDAFPRSSREQVLFWIGQARRPATRERRVEETARLAAQGIRVDRRPPRGAS
jgi:uncharacterized protein YdeI (YjbR/CyaY-like superfamily)